MALVKVRGSAPVLESDRDVEQFLGEHGVRYRRWGLPRGIAPELLDPARLSDELKARLLASYEDRLDEDRRAFGYVTADVVALAPTNPRLAEICAKFDREHTHGEDEVRFVVNGHGTFTVRGRQGEAIDITMGPGDYISVPRDRRHWFTLLRDRSIVTIRLFQDTKGWTPHYAGPGTGATEIPERDLERAFGKAVLTS